MSDDYNFDNGDQLQALQTQRDLAELEILKLEIAGKTGKQPYEVEGYLHEAARKNPEVEKAFTGRHANPQEYEKMKATITNELTPSKDYGSMTQAEFEAECRKFT